MILSKLSFWTVFGLQVEEARKGFESFNQQVTSQKQEFDDLYDYIINENSLEYEE